MSKRIRILMTISDLDGGGAERQFSMLIHSISRTQFDPFLCFWRPVYKYSYPEDLSPYIIGKTKPWHVFRALKSVHRLVDELKPDLIFSQLHYVNMVTGTALKQSRHHPRWICRHDIDPRRVIKGPFAIWARNAIKHADCILGCSEGVSKSLMSHLRLPFERVRTILNGVDVNRIDQLANESLPIEKSRQVFIVAHAGRFHPQKNQDMLLKAFSYFRGKSAELWMLGEGGLGKQLRDQAKILGIADQVKWLGFQKNPYPFFKAADCVVLTSNWEGLPMVIIEAMICGTPFVSTRCQFGPEDMIIDGQNGLLTPLNDIPAFINALVRIHDNPQWAKNMGANARKLAVTRFDFEKIYSSYEKLFIEVTNS